MEALLVPDDFDSDVLPGLVISALQHLSKRTLAKHSFDLISICKVITRDNQIITPLIVVTVIIRRHFGSCGGLGVPCARIEDLLEIYNLTPLVS